MLLMKLHYLLKSHLITSKEGKTSHQEATDIVTSHILPKTRMPIVSLSCILPLIILLFSPLLITPSQSHLTTSAIQLPSSSPTVSVTDFGAVGNGHRYDTTAIQSAIDACPTPSTCHVVFPAPGSYLTATVHLRSGVVLVVEEGAVILGGTKLEDYPPDSERWYVVMAEQAENVGITGGGEINGQGLEFVKKYDERKNVMVSWNQTGACAGDECRPRLVGFIGCTNVTISNINLFEPAYWWCVPLSLSLSLWF